MNSKSGNVFIEDRQENESFQQPCDRNIDNDEDNENNSEDQQINDEQIDQLLDDDNGSKQQIVLRFKVNQLQKICNSLTSTNRKLINKITVLEQQRQMQGRKQQQIFVDEYSQLNGQFTQVESLIHEYKQSLDQFQKNALADMKSKQERISKLKIEVKDLKQKNDKALVQKQDIQKINKQLQTRNEGLILEIQNLQKQKTRLQEKLVSKPQFYIQHGQNRYESHHPNMDYELPYEIQNQYEILIEKLVKELEYEKNIKKKMNQEIKRMAQDLMESEKQIMNKNKKLYQIQMKLLKSSKTTADSSVNHSKLRAEDFRGSLSSRQETSQRNANKGDKQQLKFNFKSFPLLSVINGEFDQQISVNQRRTIGLKVIQFYQKKIEREDFSNIMPENMLISNFNHKKPDLLSIRKIGSSVYEQGEKTEESLIWNLAFILDNLFGQTQGIQQFDQILSITGQVLEKQIQNNKQILQAIKQTICN